MNCLAVDDQPLALDVIEDFVAKVPYLKLVGKCTSAMEASKFLKEEKIDLLFLDINMPMVTGLEFVKSLIKRPMVIFTTAYPNYALEGFELKAVDYLVKPIRFERFLAAVNHAYELFLLKNNVSKNEETATDYLLIKVEYSTVKINFKDILFIKGVKDYVQIFTVQGKYLTVSTMKNIESKLPENDFLRVHKSYIISLPKIEKIERFRIWINENSIPVGDTYKKQFMEVVDKLSL